MHHNVQSERVSFYINIMDFNLFYIAVLVHRCCLYPYLFAKCIVIISDAI